MKFKVYDWLDRKIGHEWHWLHWRIQGFVCNRFDEYVMKSSGAGDGERGEIIR